MRRDALHCNTDPDALVRGQIGGCRQKIPELSPCLVMQVLTLWERVG